METFIPAKSFVDHPGYDQDRKQVLKTLDLDRIDPPVVKLVERFATLPYCFTLQCCHGHFLWSAGQTDHNPDRLPPNHTGRIDYRIAYVALCIANCPDGKRLHQSLEQLATPDPGYVQFGSADWFWQQYPNTFVLQVEPERYKHKDRIRVDHSEALHIQTVRDRFFVRLEETLKRYTGGEAKRF